MSAYESQPNNKEQLPEKQQEDQLEKQPFKVFQGETVLVKRSDGSIENDWMVSETPFPEEEFIKVYKQNPENPEETLTKGISRSDLEAMNGSVIDFSQAEDLDSLMKLIEKQGTLTGSQQEYSADTLKEIIGKVESGELETIMITRAGGLRDAFEKIKTQQQKEENRQDKILESRKNRINQLVEENIRNEGFQEKIKSVAHQINELIHSLPEDKQKEYLPTFRELLDKKVDEPTTKDQMAYYNLLKKVESEIHPPVEPNPNNAISYETVFINGEPRNIQTQEDGSGQIKINRGGGWELMSRDQYSEFLDTIDKEEDAQDKFEEATDIEEKEDIKLTKEEILKELHYTANMSPDEWRGYMSRSVSGRKRILEDITLIQKEDNKEDINIAQENEDAFKPEIENNFQFKKQKVFESSSKTDHLEDIKENMTPDQWMDYLHLPDTERDNFLRSIKNIEAPKAVNESVGSNQTLEKEISNEKSPTELLNTYKEYLSYGDIDPEAYKYALSEEGELEKNSSDARYSESLLNILNSERAESLETVKGTIRNYYEHIKKNLGLEDDYGKSDSWIYWDIAKQDFMLNNPESSSPEYLLADPLDFENSAESRELIQQIADRHIAWEICRPQNIDNINTQNLSQRAVDLIEKAKTDRGNSRALSSFEYSELGRLVREGNNEENIF